MRTALALPLAFSLVLAASASAAELGKPAPDFTLGDLGGKPVKLADYRGQVVVLEWFNPGCPYVKASHSKGSLVDVAAKATARGVAWLAINSGAPGKQGHGVELNRAAAKEWKLAHPILLDESGAAGKAYGASNTPHLFVIDKEGNLVYRGAADNSPDGERAAPREGSHGEVVCQPAARAFRRSCRLREA